MSRARLSSEDVETGLDGWSLSADGLAITRSFKFTGFARAIGFMTECALHAEKIDHHPEWSNVYRTVEVKLTTHSSKGLTSLDFDLASFMDKAAAHH